MEKLIKKYGWFFIVAVVLVVSFYVIKLVLQKKGGYIGAADKKFCLDDIKRAIQNNFFFRKKITEDINGNIKIKKDVEKDIQNIFDKYNRT